MVISLSLSKQLYEAGLRIETEKVYCNLKKQWRENEDRFALYDNDTAKARKYNDKLDEQYPAPSTDELLAVMPYKINTVDYLIIRKAFESWYVQYWDYESREMAVKIKDDLLPEALAKMCLWLLQNGYKYNEEQKCLIKEERKA